MDFWRTVLVLIRRWYVAVPAFLLSLGVAAAAYQAVPDVYESSSILVLTTPLTGGTEETHTAYASSMTNPMLNFDRSLGLAAAIVIQQMNSSEIATSLGITAGDPVTYQVTNGSSNPELLESGPFLFIVGTGPSADAAQSITDEVATRAAEVLALRQDSLGAPSSTHITAHVVVPTTAGQLRSGNPSRAAVAVLGLSGVATLTAVYGFESLVVYRRRRRFLRPGGSPGPLPSRDREPEMAAAR